MRTVHRLKIDLKKHPATKALYLLEVNLRYTLWNHLGAHCGASLPRAALLEAQSDVALKGPGVPLPEPVLAVMKAPDAHPVCDLIARLPFDWAPPPFAKLESRDWTR